MKTTRKRKRSRALKRNGRVKGWWQTGNCSECLGWEAKKRLIGRMEGWVSLDHESSWLFKRLGRRHSERNDIFSNIFWEPPNAYSRLQELWQMIWKGERGRNDPFPSWMGELKSLVNQNHNFMFFSRNEWLCFWPFLISMIHWRFKYVFLISWSFDVWKYLYIYIYIYHYKLPISCFEISIGNQNAFFPPNVFRWTPTA